MERNNVVELEDDASKLEVREIYDDDGIQLVTQWFKITDFDPESDKQFDFSDGSYLCFHEVDWKEMKWQYRILED